MFAVIPLVSKRAPKRRHSETIRTQLVIEWDFEPENEILFTVYVVEADLIQCGEFTVIWDGRERPEITRLALPETVTAYDYTFRHKAYNSNGGSEYSDEAVLIPNQAHL